MSARPTERLFGDAIPAAPPRWEAHYRTLGGTLQGELALAPFIVSQSPPRSGPRSLHFSGARIAFDGIYGDWPNPHDRRFRTVA